MQDQATLNILDGADVRKVLAGDQAAFAALYDRYFNRVYDFLARMLRDSAAAEDVTQETFIQAMTALPSLKKPEGFKSWLFTIARNQALNRLERGKRVVAMPTTITDEGEELTLDLVDEDRAADPSLPVLDRELAALVWEAAEGLDEKSYSILDLHVRQGLDSGEIADVLGVTKGNAYTMLSRVKDRFEESLAVLIVSRRGRQECDILQGMVADVPRFTPDVRDRVGKHIKSCDTCSATRRKFVVPFNIISGLAAPLPPSGLKERVWDDLMTRWPPGSADGGGDGDAAHVSHNGHDAVRMRGWRQALRRRWPISVAALLLLLLGIVTSMSLVRGDNAPPPTATLLPPTATVIAAPTETPIPPTFTPVPPTVALPTPAVAAPLVVPPTPAPATATPILPTETPVPTANAPVPARQPTVSANQPPLPTPAPAAPQPMDASPSATVTSAPPVIMATIAAQPPTFNQPPPAPAATTPAPPRSNVPPTVNNPIPGGVSSGSTGPSSAPPSTNGGQPTSGGASANTGPTAGGGSPPGAGSPTTGGPSTKGNSSTIGGPSTSGNPSITGGPSTKGGSTTGQPPQTVKNPAILVVVPTNTPTRPRVVSNPGIISIPTATQRPLR